MRTTLLALVLANAAYFAWSQGHLAGLGGAGGWADPQPTRAPQRLSEQLQPERLVLLSAPPAAAKTPEAPATASVVSEKDNDAGVCLQVSGLSDEQTSALRESLSATALPEHSWEIETMVQPARWVVYLGKFSSLEALRVRKAELRVAKVEHRDVSNPALQPGLALGTFSTEAAALQAQRDVTRGGVKNTKVVIERREVRQSALILPRATDGVQNTVRAVMDAKGADWADFTLQPCAD